MGMRVPGAYADPRQPSLKLNTFIGYRKFGDEGDTPLEYSYGGYGFNVENGYIAAEHQDFVFDDMGDVVEGYDSYKINNIFYYARLSATGAEERFLLACVSLTSGEETTVKIFMRYLPRAASDTSFDTEWTDITGDETPSAEAGRCFFNCPSGTDSLVVFTDGLSIPFYWDGTNNIARLNASAPAGRLCAYYNDRAFIGFVDEAPNAVWWSESVNPKGWEQSVDGAGYKLVVGGRGDYLTCIHANRAGLMQYKNDSAYCLYGSSPSDYRFILVSDECGAMNPKCVAEIGNVVFNFDKSGLMYFDGSNFRPFLQEELSLPVDNAYFLSSEYIERHSLFTYDGRLYLYDGYSHRLYRINVKRKRIESVKQLNNAISPVWLPMRDMCLYTAQDLTTGDDVIFQMGAGLSGRVVLYEGE